MAVLSGGDKLEKALTDIGNKMHGAVSVGFLAGATYPDGTPVAAVAFWNEFGVLEHNQPPRPFFRNMISEEKGTWPGKMAKAAKATNYDGPKVLGAIGEDIKGSLQKSINDFSSPPLSPVTIARKGFSKPLIDTAVMLNSVGSEVED